MKSFLFALALIHLAPPVFAQTPRAELSAFLVRMGLEDYVAMTREAQTQGLQYNEMNRRQQNMNMRTYETVNSSRELSVYIFSELEPRLADPATGTALADFTAKMLALKPLPPRTDYPADIMALPEGEKRSAAVNGWLAMQRREQMETHARQIVSDITGLLYGKQLAGHERDIEKIYAHVAVIVDRMYLDTLVGQTRYFGRGLAALLARHAKLTNDKMNLTTLSKTLRSKYEMRIENFLGDEWIIDGSAGAQKVKVENGSMVLTRNLSAESLQIAFAAVSALPESRKIAKNLGLIGQLRAAPFFVTPEDAAQGMTLVTKIKDKIQQMDLPMSAGFSHVGYVMVKEDPQTGVKMTFTIDNYPQMTADSSGVLANPGGVRVTGLEQMLDASHHSKIAIGTINHAKFHAWSQEASQVIGYPKDEVIYDSDAVEMKDGEHIVSENPRRDPWKIHISRAEYDDLHRMRDPDQWYKAASDNFIQKGLMDMFKRGVYFQWVTAGAYFKGGAYCSQTGFLAWLQSNGDFIERAYSPGKADEFKAKLEEMQKTIPGFKPADGWSWHVRFLARLGRLAEMMKAKNILPSIADKILASGLVQQSLMFEKMDIVAPSGLLAQDHVDSRIIDLKDRTLGERVKTSYHGYKENDRALTEEIDRLLPRTEQRFRRLLTKRVNPTDSAGAAMRDIEYRMATYGEKGIKTPGVSPDEVAEIGAENGMKSVRRRWIREGRPDAAIPACTKVFAN